MAREFEFSDKSLSPGIYFTPSYSASSFATTIYLAQCAPLTTWGAA